MKLWEIEEMFRDALNEAENMLDETGAIPEDWADFLEDVQMERDQKCLAVAAVSREYYAEADAIAAEAKRLMARAKTEQNKGDRMKAYLASVVKPGEKLKDNRIQIGWRKSKAVVIDDEAVLPEVCFKVVREISKSAVKEALESGAVKTGAHIEERQNIQVR